MYYSSGNYEAFARPKKPEGVERKSAYIVDIRTIQEILGHVQIDTTEIYTHLHDQEVMDAMLDHPLSQFKMANAEAFCA